MRLRFRLHYIDSILLVSLHPGLFHGFGSRIALEGRLLESILIEGIEGETYYRPRCYSCGWVGIQAKTYKHVMYVKN